MQNNFKKIKRNEGMAMLVSTVFFLFIALSIVAGLVGPSLATFKDSVSTYDSKQSYFLAESGIEDAYYRIANNKTIGTSTTIVLDGHSATTGISTNGSQKNITSEGNVSNYKRNLDLKLQMGAGVGFNYGLQSGNGGVTMNGGSTINGNIYSNASINAISATITGTAVAADSASLIADQVLDNPLPPPNSITFRDSTPTQDFAQSFQLSNSSPINKVQFYIKKFGAPSDATVKIVADNGGSPSTTLISSSTLFSGNVTTNFGWVDVVFSGTTSLMPGVKYWVVIDNSSSSSSKYYIIGADQDTSYPNGTAKTGQYSGSWTSQNLDGYFQVYIGGQTSLIGGASYAGGLNVGTAGVGDVWATTVKGVKVQGNLYCTTGTNNTDKLNHVKNCDTSKGSPPPQPMPFSDGNIQDWKDTASNGGIITGPVDCHGGFSGGDCIVDWAGATFGPGEITGDLTVGGGGTLTLTGTLYVHGNITVTGGGNIELPPNYALNSETIVADGWVSIGGGGSLGGSGTSGSYLFVASTSQCPNTVGCAGHNAISVSGGGGALAVDAQYGNIDLSGGCNISSAVGNSISMTGGATVTYNTGLASPSFVSGPSGGWVVDGWKETP